MMYIDALCNLLQRELGNFGCKVGCCVLSDSTQDHKFVVVNNCVTQFYLPHEPAQCLVFEGKSLYLTGPSCGCDQ